MRMFLGIACVLMFGCNGPLSYPMVERLDEESQKQVDDAWRNMFTPPDRLDHTLLLDVIITGQFHQRGVDRLQMVSEKRVGDGLVVMEIRFDRQDPEWDQFSISYIDKDGHEVRRERFSREEVHTRLDFLYNPRPDDLSDADLDNADEATQERIAQHDAEREARMKEILAATQPAESPGR